MISIGGNNKKNELIIDIYQSRSFNQLNMSSSASWTIPLWTQSPSKKNMPIGCKYQVHKAKTIVTDVGLLEGKERQITRPLSLVYIPDSVCGTECRCRIAENGTIDCSDCVTSHALSEIPEISRWCYQTIGHISGASYLQGWSGWAAPSVMKLLGRWPAVSAVIAMYYRSEKNTTHRKRYILGTTFESPDHGKFYRIGEDFNHTPGSKSFINLLESLDMDGHFD
jgi:hypothetical protein